MFIQIDDCIINPDGSLAFEAVITERGSKVWSERSKASIVCDSPDDARACLAGLAERLYAQRWDPTAKCFVPVSYNPDTVGRIVRYMSLDGFSDSRVDDVSTLVSLMNLSEESDREVQAFVKMTREKYLSNYGGDDLDVPSENEDEIKQICRIATGGNDDPIPL